MTAIAIVHTSEGFLLGADGRMRLDDESRRTASAEVLAQESDDQQKIFSLIYPHTHLAFAVTGTVRDPAGFDLRIVSRRQAETISQRSFEDFRTYLKVLGGKINRSINEARHDGTLETFPELSKMENSPAWRIASLYFCGYFDDLPAFSRIDFFHCRRDSQFEITSFPSGATLLMGSQVVRQYMYPDNPEEEPDSRFANFIKELHRPPLFEDAMQFARGYIEACSSPLGLEVDESICRGIGGHIHMATITKAEGFTRVIEPVASSLSGEPSSALS